MTSPLSPESVAQMVADREAGTPGPWESKTGVKVCESEFSQWIYAHKYGCLGYWTGHKDRHEGIHSWLLTEVDARRIARLPDLEAAYLTLAAENATLRASEAAALDRVKVLTEALKEGRRAIGGHYAPHDCYATGPMTGDAFRDLVQCPACSFIAMHDAALTPTADKE